MRLVNKISILILDLIVWVYFLLYSNVYNILIKNLTLSPNIEVFVLLILYYYYIICSKFFLKNFFLIKIFYINILYINLDNTIILALSNNLFLIHSYFVFYTLIYVLKKPLINFNTHIWWLFLLCLGGLWSTQEFNWGGWWNWDILEASSVFIVVSFIYLLHKTNKFIVCKQWKYYLLSLYFIFYYSNKLGILNSIHSFVLNFKFKNYWYVYIILISVLHFFTKKLISCFYFYILWFLFLKNIFILFFLKYVFFIIFFIIFKYLFFKKLKLNIIHQLIWISCVIIFVINFKNTFSFLNNNLKISHINWSLTKNHLLLQIQNTLNLISNNTVFFKLNVKWIQIIWLFNIISLFKFQIYFYYTSIMLFFKKLSFLIIFKKTIK